MKFLLVLFVVVGMFWWLSGRSARQQAVRRKAAAPKPQGPVAMVECAHCGVHLPRDEAVLAGSTPYCGQAHLLAGPRPH